MTVTILLAVLTLCLLMVGITATRELIREAKNRRLHRETVSDYILFRGDRVRIIRGICRGQYGIIREIEGNTVAVDIPNVSRLIYVPKDIAQRY